MTEVQQRLEATACFSARAILVCLALESKIHLLWEGFCPLPRVRQLPWPLEALRGSYLTAVRACEPKVLGHHLRNCKVTAPDDQLRAFSPAQRPYSLLATIYNGMQHDERAAGRSMFHPKPSELVQWQDARRSDL